MFQPEPYQKDEGQFERDLNFAIMSEDYLKISSEHPKFSKTATLKPLSASRGILKISIYDTGVGINLKEVPDLFEKFTEIKAAEGAEQIMGIGLSLYISRKICEKMGGQMKAYSQIGMGSCFVYCLPIIVTTDLSAISSCNLCTHHRSIYKSMPNNKRDVKRALVVDDEKFNGRVISGFLERLKVTDIVICENGEDAVKEYMKAEIMGQRFDLVTMDYEMPRMNGKEAVMRIREYEEKERVEKSMILMVSAHCTESIIDGCLNDPRGKPLANAFLKKPLSFEKIGSLVLKEQGREVIQ